jgi:type III secretory pathway component EscS
MTDQVLLAIITAIPPTVAAVAGLIIGIVNRGKIKEIHIATNSMKDALVAATRSEALMEGHAAGVAQEQSRKE